MCSVLHWKMPQRIRCSHFCVNLSKCYVHVGAGRLHLCKVLIGTLKVPHSGSLKGRELASIILEICCPCIIYDDCGCIYLGTVCIDIYHVLYWYHDNAVALKKIWSFLVVFTQGNKVKVLETCWTSLPSRRDGHLGRRGFTGLKCIKTCIVSRCTFGYTCLHALLIETSDLMCFVKGG